MRLIDADALMDEVGFIPTSMSVCLTREEYECRRDTRDACERVIRDAPTIDAIPVWCVENCVQLSLALGDDRAAGMLRSMLDLWRQQGEEAFGLRKQEGKP